MFKKLLGLLLIGICCSFALAAGLVPTYDITIQPGYAVVTRNSNTQFTVTLLNSQGSPMAATAVSLRLAAGPGTLSAASVLTNGSGQAVFTYTAPNSYGCAVIEATGLGAKAAASLYIQNGTIRYVPSGGAPSYATIQAALNACVVGDTVRINNGTYTENLAWPNVSSVLLRGVDDSGSANCIINGNAANLTVYCANAVTLSMLNVQVRGGRNTATTGTRRYGAGVNVYNTTGVAVLSLHGVLITANNAVARASNTYDLGGGIYFYGSELLLVNTKLAKNTARRGGGIYLRSNRLQVWDSVITSNNATTLDGGGVYLATTTLGAAFTQSVFSQNTARRGGGIYLINTIAIPFTGVTFRENRANLGGATAQGYLAEYTDCVFEGNQAVQNGGAFYQTSVSLNNCLISGNRAVNGSGGVLYVNNVNRTSSLRNTLVSANNVNTTSGLGGCFYANNTTARVQSNDSMFLGNRAYRGGVFYNNTVLQDRDWLARNSAANAGGVYYTSLITVNNSVVAFNSGGTNGGVAYSSLANRFLNSTFVSNNATNGQVLFVSAGTPRIMNSIIYGSPNPFNNTTPVVTYTRLDTAYTGVGNITRNPIFIDAPAENFQLRLNSPCINAATANVLYDHTGASRPQCGGYDMGAYESPVIATPNIVVLSRAASIAHPGNYTGPTTNIVPGCIVTYTISVENQSSANATSCNISDKLPNNTHFYGETIPPTFNGTGVTNIQYLGPTQNSAGAGTSIIYSFDMLSEARATLSYSISVD